MAPAIQVEGVSKRYGAAHAVQNVNLSVARGEYLCVMGASGSGKSTLLRVIAGLETPDAGTVRLGGRDATALPPHKRGVPMVFQSHALWPHMTLLEQTAFGLVEDGTPKSQARIRAGEALARSGLSGLEARRPAELSGGERQRAALARALVMARTCLLLDEPLANLDTHLRCSLRADLAGLCRSRGLAVIHVSHDREDAFHLADTVAILDGGGLVAAGPPHELYARPPTLAAALLLGEANRVAGTVLGAVDGMLLVDTPQGRWSLPALGSSHAERERVTVVFRPEAVRPLLASPDAATNAFKASVARRSFRPPAVVHQLDCPGRDGQTLRLLWSSMGEADYSSGWFSVPCSALWAVRG